MTGQTRWDEAVTTDVPADERAGTPGRGTGRGIRRTLVRFRARIRSNVLLNTTWRIGIFVVGWVIVLAGLVMMVAPGPGIAAIVVGFAILATEFVWARHLLRRARRAAVKAKEQALDPRVRRRNQVLAAGATALAAGVVAAYLWRFGLTLPWDALTQLGVM